MRLTAAVSGAGSAAAMSGGSVPVQRSSGGSSQGSAGAPATRPGSGSGASRGVQRQQVPVSEAAV